MGKPGSSAQKQSRAGRRSIWVEGLVLALSLFALPTGAPAAGEDGRGKDPNQEESMRGVESIPAGWIREILENQELLEEMDMLDNLELFDDANLFSPHDF